MYDQDKTRIVISTLLRLADTASLAVCNVMFMLLHEVILHCIHNSDTHGDDLRVYVST